MMQHRDFLNPNLALLLLPPSTKASRCGVEFDRINTKYTKRLTKTGQDLTFLIELLDLLHKDSSTCCPDTVDCFPAATPSQQNHPRGIFVMISYGTYIERI
jgi:hypothetical protein